MAKRLRVHFPRHDDGEAFLPDSDGGLIADDGALESELVEDYLASAVTGQKACEELRNQVVVEEFGGPFITTEIAEELDEDVDERWGSKTATVWRVDA